VKVSRNDRDDYIRETCSQSSGTKARVFVPGNDGCRKLGKMQIWRM